MLSPVLACRKIRILNPCCNPSPPPRITSEKRRIFGGVSTLKWTQNGSVLEENGTFFDKFWIDLGKMRTFDRLSRNFARSFMLDSWHTRLFEQEHKRNTSRIFRKPERRFQILMPEQNQIAWPSKGYSQHGLKNEQKDSTNVRHAVIARATKDSTPFTCKLCQCWSACLRRRKRLNRSHAQASAPWTRLP